MRPFLKTTSHLFEKSSLLSSVKGRAFSSSTQAASVILVERRSKEKTSPSGGVGLITLNRPKALNALNSQLVSEINAACKAFDSDASVGAIVLTGSERAFAAGADIKEMATKSFSDAYTSNMFADWADIAKIRKPIIAAVSGFALGGGCELAMTCDVIYAGEGAIFGQPEVLLGTIPGCGGTQRLVRAVGKSKAMEMILSGDYKMNAQEALSFGLVARVVPGSHSQLVDSAVDLGLRIAGLGHVSVAMAKEAVNASDETSLAEGLRLERRLFHSTFATADQKEGMAAFISKRPAAFKNL
jgi:enoyl-CoA hydratase/carnithine racemase